MKKLLILVILAFLAVVILAGCTSEDGKDVPAAKSAKSEKLQIVATLFPQYDFAKQIAGDKSDVVLLLPPGMESHSFEPTPSDIIRINQSDLFLYTGENMEIWSQKIIDAMKNSNSNSLVLDLSQNIDLVKTEEIEAEHHHEEGETEHHHEDGEHEHENKHFYDPHIWTDPLNAKVMVSDIRDALCSIDPANAGYYSENADRYLDRLNELDARFRLVIGSAKRNEIIFGSRFAFYYLVKRYGLEYESAFDSCSSETEPSARAVADLIKEVREKRFPVIYYAELEDPKVARSISAETGAEMLLLHSCHNVTKEELEKGVTYLSLMEQNIKNLKEGLD